MLFGTMSWKDSADVAWDFRKALHLGDRLYVGQKNHGKMLRRRGAIVLWKFLAEEMFVHPSGAECGWQCRLLVIKRGSTR